MADYDVEMCNALKVIRPDQLKDLIDLEDVCCVLDKFGNTALHVASLEPARLACAQKLIEKGAHLDLRNARGQTPLHIACESENVDFIRFLISIKDSFNINSKDGRGDTGLHICVRKANDILLNILLEAGANVNEVNRDGNTPLHCEIIDLNVSGKSKGIFERLLQSNVDVDIKNRGGFTAYHLALNFDLDKAITLLNLTSKEILHDLHKSGKVLIHRIIEHELTERLQDVIDQSNDFIYYKNKNKVTALHYAAMKSYNDGVRLLLMNDINRIPEESASKAMFISIVERDEPLLKSALLNCGCINLLDSRGRGPLHWAVLMGFLHGIEMLLKKGVDVNQKDELGTSPLHLAVLVNNKDIIEMLLSHGADVNMKDEDGRTPLHYASLLSDSYPFKYSNNSNLVVLIKAGCLLDLQDCDGNTPLDLAYRDQNCHAVEALLNWGARKHISFSGDSPCVRSSDSSSNFVFKLHIIKLKQASLESYNGNLFCGCRSIISKHYPCVWDCEFLGFTHSCIYELNRMMELKLGNFHLHDVLTMKDRSLIFDEEFKSALFSTCIEEQFPRYGHMLQAIFFKSEQRYQWISESVRLPLRAVTRDGNEVYLPDEVKWMIFSYLSEEDLVNVIKAVA